MWYFITGVASFVLGVVFHNLIATGLRKERDAALKIVQLLEAKVKQQLENRVTALEVNLKALADRLAK